MSHFPSKPASLHRSSALPVVGDDLMKGLDLIERKNRENLKIDGKWSQWWNILQETEANLHCLRENFDCDVIDELQLFHWDI